MCNFYIPINLKLYKLYFSAVSILSWIKVTVWSWLAVAWYDKHSNATFCFAINLHAFSYICVLCIPSPQNIAKASNIETSDSVNGKPLPYKIELNFEKDFIV